MAIVYLTYQENANTDSARQAAIPAPAFAAGAAVYLAWLHDAGNGELIAENGSDGRYSDLLASLWASWSQLT